MERNNLRERVFEMTQMVPVGKVTTYGTIAQMLGLRDVRLVGYMLHTNTSQQVPCHRVVTKNGRIAPNFAFDGAAEQHHRLESEGVTFIDELHVDMKKHFFNLSGYVQ